MESVEARLKHLADEGVFGGGKLVEIENNSGEGKGEQCMSEVKFFKLRFLESNVHKCHNVIAKVQLKDIQRTEECRTDLQFANEAAMYGTILPKLEASGYAPKMFYANTTEGNASELDIIVLEDLRSSGYKIADGLFMDFDHVALSLRKLGEYHGLSYRKKRESPSEIGKLSDAMLHPREYKASDPDGLFEAVLMRGFAPVIENPIAESAYKKLVDILREQNANTNIVAAEEPFAVISHGDFNRNNIMYNYDSDGKVSDVKFIDFAFSIYSDPAYDITFFLYMNTSGELRRQHWDDFLRIYWEGVRSVCDPVFEFEEFRLNLAKKAVYSYCHCCFWLPMMICPSSLTERESCETDEETLGFSTTIGGEEATAAVCDIVRHLLDVGYLEEFVNNFQARN